MSTNSILLKNLEIVISILCQLFYEYRVSRNICSEEGEEVF